MEEIGTKDTVSDSEIQDLRKEEDLKIKPDQFFVCGYFMSRDEGSMSFGVFCFDSSSVYPPIRLLQCRLDTCCS